MQTKQSIEAKKTLWLLTGSIIASIGASICCIAPLVLLPFGIGGVWMTTITSLETFRPFFIVLTIFLIGLGLRNLYKTPKNCNQDEACALAKVTKKQRLIFNFSSGLILLLLALPNINLVSDFFSIQMLHTKPSAQTQANNQSVTLLVQNMNCVMCKTTIKNALQAVNGVQKVTVDLASKTVIIIFDQLLTSSKSLVEVTTNSGYPAMALMKH